MICVRCGECCKKMCPFTEGECPHLSFIDDVAICAIYPDTSPLAETWVDRRPKKCQDHEYPARICPIGLQVLGIVDGEGIEKRGEKVRNIHGGKDSCKTKLCIKNPKGEVFETEVSTELNMED